MSPSQVGAVGAVPATGVIVLPHASVTLYVLVMISGHVPLDASLTKATTGTEQLSASSVTTVMSGAGTSPIHCTVIGAGFDAVGKMSSER